MLLLLAFGLLALVRRRPEFGAGWVWPVPDASIGGTTYRAVITDGLGSPRPGGRVHNGVDVMYARRAAADRPEYRRGTSSGSPGAIAPEGTPIVAARAGRVQSATKTARGYAVVLDHGAPFETFYQHLDVLMLPEHRHGVSVATGKPTLVNAGDVLGTMGFDPLDPAKLRHLHFEAWHGGSPVDPAAAMASWPRVPWKFDPTTYHRKA